MQNIVIMSWWGFESTGRMIGETATRKDDESSTEGGKEENSKEVRKRLEEVEKQMPLQAQPMKLKENQILEDGQIQKN